MDTRWQLTAAIIGSLLLHGVGLIGISANHGKPELRRQQDLPLRAQLIVARDGIAADRPVVHLGEARGQPRTAVSRPSPPASNSQLVSDGSVLSRTKLVRTHEYASESRIRSGNELDPPPKPVVDIEPVYPPTADSEEGTVVLRLTIGVSGVVENVIVVRSDPEGVFEPSAVAAFRSAQFSPGYYLGVPVRSQIDIAVDYTPTNRGTAISGAGAALGSVR